MKQVYDTLSKIQDQLQVEPFINTVTFGSLNDVDLDKQSIFPLGHLTMNSTSVATNVFRFNMSILVMDIVDISKEETTDKFTGNDNEQDVLNTQMAVINRLLELLRRGDLYTELYQLDGSPTIEPFVDRFENKLAGWTLTMDVLVTNDMTIC